MLRVSGACVAILALLLTLTATAYAADPGTCRVLLRTGICIVSAVDPGRVGREPTTAREVSRPQEAPPNTGRAATHRGTRLPAARTAAQRYVDELRRRVLGQQPPTSPAAPRPPRGAPPQQATARAQQAESVRRAVNELNLAA